MHPWKAKSKPKQHKDDLVERGLTIQNWIEFVTY